MFRKVRSFLLFVVIAGCVDPYQFVVENPEPTLVVEGYISDKSYNETLSYPSDGRYFTIKLSYTGDVTNRRPTRVPGALVELLSSEGENLSYTEGEPGIYSLLDADFKALPGQEYRLRISVGDESVYESEWEKMPDVEIPSIGAIGFTETEKQVYAMEANKWMLRTKQIVAAHIEVPKNNSGQLIYYRWTYAPTWIYVAPLISQNDPVFKCWATDPNYLNTYGLQIDRSGAYKKELFDFPTVRNERIFEKLSVLVTQQAMTEPYYNFWKEMKEQNEGSSMMDKPPYNLKTNFKSAIGKRVSGYFGITSEQATRWYFDRTDLSYYVPNTLRADCLVVYGPGPPAPECLNCTAYSFGKATTQKPWWWED